MANLLNKLRMLEAEPQKTAPKLVTRENSFHRCQSVFPISLLGDRSHARPDILECIYGFSFPENLSHEDILFLDTETTGLSGGAGTVAFQIGVGYFTHSGFVVEQFMMHDYPEEASMLQTLNALMKRFTVICTFNGRTFDIPLLKTRFIMNRIAEPSIPSFHADALYPSRRLWKLRLKKCNLAHLEEQLLNVVREDDLPGALVPQTFFQYLKDGNFQPMERILEHNKQDIVSLAQLFYFMCKQVDVPEEIAESEDLFSLARALEKNGQQEKAIHCYRLSSNTQMCAYAHESLARIEKRRGNTDAAVKLYQTMLVQNEKPVIACEALAKLHEHKLRDIPAALSYTRQALLLLSEPALFQNETVQEQRIALQYRYTRLRKKLSAMQTK